MTDHRLSRTASVRSQARELPHGMEAFVIDVAIGDQLLHHQVTQFAGEPASASRDRLARMFGDLAEALREEPPST